MVVADAADLPVAAASVDRIVTNPPWGAQVEAVGVLASGPDRLWPELARVLRSGGHAVVLTPDGDVPDVGLDVIEVRPISLRGLHPVAVIASRQ